MALTNRRRVMLTLTMLVVLVTMIQTLDSGIIDIRMDRDEQSEVDVEQVNQVIEDEIQPGEDSLEQVNQDIEVDMQPEESQLSATVGGEVEVLPKSQYILIMSSLPRSGSTLLAELLNTHDESVLFFEPLWLQQKAPCGTDGACIQRYIRDIYGCQYNDDFEKWLRSKQLFLRYYNSETQACLSKSDSEKKACIPELKLREDCEQSRVRLMKVIRASLSWLEEMLADSSIDFKIIHLIRDPRGSLYSISRFKSWDKSPKNRCSQLLSDMNSYDHLVQSYSNKLMRVTLEELSLEPWDVTRSIFHFLYGQNELPEKTQRFLKVHMSTAGPKNTMNTIRDSKREYEAWRYKISSRLLKDVENEPSCREIINKLGHKLFGSQKEALNENISLFL